MSSADDCHMKYLFWGSLSLAAHYNNDCLGSLFEPHISLKIPLKQVYWILISEHTKFLKLLWIFNINIRTNSRHDIGIT